MWISKNFKEHLENSKFQGFSEIDSIKTIVFSVLYRTIPQDKLESTLLWIIGNCVLNKHSTWKYK
jgi:hypothetical protein